jgi:hypothetical protein
MLWQDDGYTLQETTSIFNAFANILLKNIRMFLKQIKANAKREKRCAMHIYDSNIMTALPNKKAIWIFHNCH